MRSVPILVAATSLSMQLAVAADVFPEPDVRRFSDRQFADRPEWVEENAALPAFPRDADLIEFSVSAATSNRFFIDAANLAVGRDGVIRYTLVIRAAGGATNVSYEGIRCGDASLRRYAVGRTDGSWSWLRTSDWRPIENKLANRQYAALYKDYFCPLGNPIASVGEGRDALRRGQHPAAGATGPYGR